MKVKDLISKLAAVDGELELMGAKTEYGYFIITDLNIEVDYFYKIRNHTDQYSSDIIDERKLIRLKNQESFNEKTELLDKYCLIELF